MSVFKLYCFAQSGNAYKPALMLNLCAADWSPVFVDYFNGETRSETFRRLNPMGEVPVLVHGTITLSQSGVILDYLADVLGRFKTGDKDQQREVLRWLLFDNHKLTGSVSTLRYLLQFAKTGQTQVTQFLKTRMHAALRVLENQLEKTAFVTGANPTIADISICGYLFWPDEFGIEWDDYPAIQRWLDRIKDMPGWVPPYELMPGHPLPD